MVNRHALPLAGYPHLALLPENGREFRFFEQAKACSTPDGGFYADRYDFDRASGIGIAVDFMMLFVKRAGAVGGAPRDIQLVALACIADIGGAFEVGAGHILARGLLQVAKARLDVGAMQGTGGIVAHTISQQHTES